MEEVAADTTQLSGGMLDADQGAQRPGLDQGTRWEEIGEGPETEGLGLRCKGVLADYAMHFAGDVS